MRMAAVVLLLSTSVLSAQTSSSSPAGLVMQQEAPAERALGDGCPVSFSASRDTWGGELRAVGRGVEGDSAAASVSLLFTPEAKTGVVAARVTVYGLAGQQIAPAGSAAAGRKVRESFTLALLPDGERRFVSVVHARRVTGIETIELDKLTYADGRVWRSSVEKQCRVVPDGLVLVGLK